MLFSWLGLCFLSVSVGQRRVLGIALLWATHGGVGFGTTLHLSASASAGVVEVAAGGHLPFDLAHCLSFVSYLQLVPQRYSGHWPGQRPGGVA
jgi:hypothetical protein